MNIDAQFNETGGIFHADMGEEREISDVEQIRAEISTSRDEDKKLYNNLYANALRGAASGSSVRLSDISPNEHTLGVKVKRKNLFDITSALDTNNWSKCPSSGYSNYRISGLKPNIKYIFSMSANNWSGVANNGFYVSINTTQNNTWVDVGSIVHNSGAAQYCHTSKTITSSNNGDLYLQFYDVTAERLATCFNGLIDLQLEIGSARTAYTPYISDFSTVKVTRCGKNLIPYPYATTTPTISGVTFTVQSDGSITANGTATANVVFELEYDATMFTLPVGNYFLSGCPSGGSTKSYFMAAANGAGINYDKFLRDFGNGISVPSKGEKWKITIRIISGYTADNLVFKPQIELGSTATEYEPYKTPTEYTPAADGTISGVKSLYPTTTLMTNTEGAIISAEYNRDINKAFAELQQAILSIGGNT